MQISPKTSQWINVGFAFLVVMASGAVVFPDYVPAIVARYIVQTNACLLAILTGVNLVLHRYSSAEPGPGVTPAAPAADKGGKVSLVAFLMALGLGAALLAPAPASAATVSLDKLVAQLQSVSLDDAQAALADATATGDTVSSSCYAAFIKLVQAQQAANGASLPKVHLITTFQRARDLRLAVRTGSPIRTACAPLAAEVNMDFTTFLGAIATGGLTAAKLGAAL